MKIILSLIALFVSASVHALPGKQEFVIDLAEEQIRVINDTNKMIVLRAKKIDKDRLQQLSEPVCFVSPLVNNKSKMGDKEVAFYDDYAIVNNKKRYYYERNKTELIFYRSSCPKLPN